MKELPPGQKESDIFPRFGLPQYAERFPKNIDHINISIGGDVEAFAISQELSSLSRVEQISDFHCVTTWSKMKLNWSGYLFNEFYEKLIYPAASDDMTFVIIKAQDGYKTSLPLEDLLKQNVLLADQLDGHALSVEHGAPIRIIAPDHYGYKNVKYIDCIEFYKEKQTLKKGLAGFMDHPRARVALEERVSNGPGIIFRWLYKFGINSTIKDFEKATEAYKANQL
ncbi:molybdopterin-dependent oxidoreductase [Saprospiraceae bacterium]|nr:molybdopterin-dependent oxidoreductase [Saprospiraceae bacterium]